MRNELDEFPIPQLVPPIKHVSPNDTLRRYGDTKRDTTAMAEIAEDLYTTRSATARGSARRSRLG